MKMIKLQLPGCSFSYDIRIGSQVLANLDRILPELTKPRRYVAITDSHVLSLHGLALQDKIKQQGGRLTMEFVDFPAGEASKTMDTVLSLVRKLMKLGADRETVLIALGGGVVGDIVGFLASLYMRSVPYLQIPTTLVAQVDSSIGGKTAIDLPEGKNLLGTFYQPRAVLIDPSFLVTLPDAEFSNGLAEIIKYGAIDRRDLFPLLEDNMTALRARQQEILVDVIEKACRIKKDLVEIDERDRGPRRFLNFGHTLGHALEAASNYRISHGQGVSLGMIAAVHLSEKMCSLPPSQGERIIELIRRAGLPMTVPGDMDTKTVLCCMRADKKKAGNAINFVLLKNLGEPVVTSAISEAVVRETVEELKNEGR